MISKTLTMKVSIKYSNLSTNWHCSLLSLNLKGRDRASNTRQGSATLCYVLGYTAKKKNNHTMNGLDMNAVFEMHVQCAPDKNIIKWLDTILCYLNNSIGL